MNNLICKNFVDDFWLSRATLCLRSYLVRGILRDSHADRSIAKHSRFFSQMQRNFTISPSYPYLLTQIYFIEHTATYQYQIIYRLCYSETIFRLKLYNFLFIPTKANLLQSSTLQNPNIGRSRFSLYIDDISYKWLIIIYTLLSWLSTRFSRSHLSKVTNFLIAHKDMLCKGITYIVWKTRQSCYSQWFRRKTADSLKNAVGGVRFQ